MKNEEMILKTRINLMNARKIGTTGRKMTILDNNQQEIEIDEPAPIHTYTGWKREGYQVPKGTKSTIFIPIWTRQVNPDGSASMFQRNAAFFTQEQVVPIEDIQTVSEDNLAVVGAGSADYMDVPFD